MDLAIISKTDTTSDTRPPVMPTVYLAEEDPDTGYTTFVIQDMGDHVFKRGPRHSLSAQLDSVISRVSRYSGSDELPPQWVTFRRGYVHVLVA